MASSMRFMSGDSGSDLAKKFYSNLETDVKVEKNIEALKYDEEWIDKIEYAIPYLNKIFENPKKFIIGEDEILNIEKTRKVTVESIKHLSKHTNFISEFDEESGKVTPNKLLNVLKEETYNIYENRFIYTLVDLLADFVTRMKEILDNGENKKDTAFYCDAKTRVQGETVKFTFRANSTKENVSDDKKNEIYKRIEYISATITNWKETVLYKNLKAQRVPKVTNPLNRTNTIKKNPNFNTAAGLWDYICAYYENENAIKTNTPTESFYLSDDLSRLVDTSMLLCYLAMTKSQEKAKMRDDEYNGMLRSAAMNLFRDSLEMLVNADSDLDTDDIVKEAEKKFEMIKRVKGMDRNGVKTKIKDTLNKYIEKIEDSYFEIETGEKNE